jgi:hypothetical protein
LRTLVDERYGYLVGIVIGTYLLVLAVAFLSYSSDRAGRGPLAVFMALVGTNQILVGTNLLFGAASAASPSLLHIAEIVQLLDGPVVVLACVAVVHQRVARILWLGAGALGLGLTGLYFAGLGPLASGPGIAEPWVTLTLNIQRAILYAAAAATLIIGWAREPRPNQKDRLAILVVALGGALLTRLPLVLKDLDLKPGSVMLLGALAAVTAAAVALLLIAARHATPTRAAMRLAGWLSLVMAASGAVWVFAEDPALFPVFHGFFYSGRWLVFAIVVTAGIHRLGLLDVGARAERRLWAAIVVTAFLTAASILWSILSGLGNVDPIAGLFAAGVVALLLFGLAAGLSISRPLLGQALHERRLAVYRAHLELGSSPRKLKALRARLRIRDREAQEMELVAGAQRTAAAAAEGLALGTVLAGRYQVRALMGIGGFSRAYLAFDRVARGTVVLKELAMKGKSSKKAVEHEVRPLLEVEHPHLVRYLDLERVGAGWVVVLEHVEGPTLREVLSRGPIPLHLVRRVGAGLAGALAALHAKGIVHADVKPDNVVLRHGKHPVLLDLGAARPAHATRADAVAGTDAYLSPERRSGQPPAPTDDVHALGVLLWECVSGRLPPHGAVPPGIRSVLRTTLVPGRRPSAAELERLLSRTEFRFGVPASKTPS